MHFPENLLFFMRPNNFQDSKSELKDVIKNSNASQVFLKWAQNNNNAALINQSKKLSLINAYVLKFNTSEQTPTNSTEDTALKLQAAVGNDTLVGEKENSKRKRDTAKEELTNKKMKISEEFKPNEICQGIEEEGVEFLINLKPRVFCENLPAVFSYFQMGVLDAEDLKEIIAVKCEQCTDDEGDYYVEEFFNEIYENIDSLLPIFEHFNEDQIFTLFSLIDMDKNSLIHEEYSREADAMFPFIERLSADHLEEILTKRNEDNHFPETFLSRYIDDDFDRAVSVFEKLKPAQLTNIFTAQGLYDSSILQLACYFKGSFDSDSLLRIFLEDNEEEEEQETVIHLLGDNKNDPEYINDVKELIEILSCDALFTLLCVQNKQGNTAVHNPDTWFALPFDRLNEAQLCHLFSIKNSAGATAFEAPERFISYLVGEKISRKNNLLMDCTLAILKVSKDLDQQSLMESNFKSIFLRQLDLFIRIWRDLNDVLFKERQTYELYSFFWNNIIAKQSWAEKDSSYSWGMQMNPELLEDLEKVKKLLADLYVVANDQPLESKS